MYRLYTDLSAVQLNPYTPNNDRNHLYPKSLHADVGIYNITKI